MANSDLPDDVIASEDPPDIANRRLDSMELCFETVPFRHPLRRKHVRFTHVMVAMVKIVVLLALRGEDQDKKIMMKVDPIYGYLGEHALHKMDLYEFMEDEESLLWINE